MPLSLPTLRLARQALLQVPFNWTTPDAPEAMTVLRTALAEMDAAIAEFDKTCRECGKPGVFAQGHCVSCGCLDPVVT